MMYPTTSIYVHLPEELGIIQNVNAVIEISNKEKIIVPCKHIERYRSLDEETWPKIFDENLKQILISENYDTSIFEGIYTFFSEAHLEGTLYFTFDFCKDSHWYYCTTDSKHFKEDEDNYYGLLELLN